MTNKPAADACFDDWKRFCLVLREIASGENGRSLSGLEAQKRAQTVLTDCGYAWPGRAQVHEPTVVLTTAAESLDGQASMDPQQSLTVARLKSTAKTQSTPDRRRSDTPTSEHRVTAAPRKSPRTHIPRALGYR
jgi:hypothetical protein